MAVLEVKTIADQERFDRVWMSNWLFEFESYLTKEAKRFIFTDGAYDIGTIEIIPYHNIPEWPINKTFPFHLYSELEGKRVFEVDKMTIKEEFRGTFKYLAEIFNNIMCFNLSGKYDYCVSLLDPKLYEAIVWKLNIPVKKLALVGKEELPYIPVIFESASFFESSFGKRMLRTYHRSLVHTS